MNDKAQINEKDIQKSLAALIKNTRTTHRHLSLIEIADWLDIAIHGLGSLKEVANRIDLSEKMLKQFQYIRKLAPKVQKLFATRTIDSVDIAVHLSMFNDQEQIEVAKKLASGNLNSADVRAIRELRKEVNNLSINEIIEKVKASRDIKHYVAEFVVRSQISDEESLRNLFSKVLEPQNIISLNLKGSIGKIIINERGWQLLQKYAKKHRLTKAQALTVITQGDVK
ncbi:hypothetical protein C6A36_00100 [Desulfobacteraceae bacterium SEEP-SAG10]|nr:hypothetical protein C6A36_00100 [Desulfobacteraceae bacterium SEEP-SAG10]